MAEAAATAAGYEFENPAQSWISLVEACHLAELNLRKQAAQKFIFLAKNSHWTQELYQAELEQLDAEYGGSFDSEPEEDDGGYGPQELGDPMGDDTDAASDIGAKCP